MASTRPTISTRHSEKSARDTFFYYSGAHPSAVRYKNWKIYFAMVPDTATGLLLGCQHLPLDPGRNIKRDPFEHDGWCDAKSLLGSAAARSARRAPRIIYDWNMLPIGQAAVAEGAGILQGVPADAGPGELQPGSGIEQLKKCGRPGQ